LEEPAILKRVIITKFNYYKGMNAYMGKRELLEGRGPEG